jgi:hypothetical protein
LLKQIFPIISPQEYYPRKITRAYYTLWYLYPRNIT